MNIHLFKVLRTVVFLLLASWGSQHLQAQNSPEEVGKLLLRMLQQQNVDSSYILFPTTRELVKLCDSVGITILKEDIEDITRDNEVERVEFKKEFLTVIREGVESDIVWKDVRMKNVQRRQVEGVLVDGENPVNLVFTDIDIEFYYRNRVIVLTLGHLYPFGSRWKIMQHSLTFENP